MTRWAERAKNAINQRSSTDKTDKSLAPSLLAVSSVPTKDIPLSEKSVSSVLTVSVPTDVEKNDSISAIKEDPDRWCWPNSPAMNGREIGIFSIRLEHLRSLGLDLDSAEKLADRLVIRDRDKDDRIVCFECCHLRNGWRCMNWRNAGAWVDHSNSNLQNDFVHQLQRCPGYKSVIGEVNEHR
jgi:hypothetical protein